MATFYIDADNGDDATNDGSSPTKTNGDGPFKTLNKFTETGRNAGDIAILRRGMTGRYDDGGDLEFTSDGTIDNPIRIEADFGDEWSDFANSSQTYTLVFGSKSMLSSAAITVLVDNNWIFNTTDGDDPREFSYEVANVQASDSGTDDGANSNRLIDTGKFANTVLGTQVVNTTDSITGFVSELVGNDEVEVTDDGRPSGAGATIVVFDNGDTWTIANQAVLFLPFKGSTGSTKTLKIMTAAPTWNTAAGAFQWNFDSDHYWKIQGLLIRGTDSNGNVEIDSAGGHVFKDVIFEGNGSGDRVLNSSDDTAIIRVLKCRFFNYQLGIRNFAGSGAHWAYIKDSLFDGNSVSTSVGIEDQAWSNNKAEETEFRNHSTGDIGAVGLAQRTGKTTGRNLLLSSTTEIDLHQNAVFSEYPMEDFNGTVGDTRQLTGFSTAEGTPIFQSETSTVRSGGSTISIKFTPSTDLSTNWEFGRIKLFELPIYATTSSKTYTVYFASDTTTEWTASPSATELWIELEYWGHASNNFRRITKSTGTIDMTTDTDFDQTLTVTVAPAQAGVAYLRCYYAKTKEGGKANIFYTDPIPEIA